jgi:hypothetical protein
MRIHNPASKEGSDCNTGWHWVLISALRTKFWLSGEKSLGFDNQNMTLSQKKIIFFSNSVHSSHEGLPSSEEVLSH